MLFQETFYVYSISVWDVGEVEIVSYSLFVQLNIGRINHPSASDTNKAKDQRRAGFYESFKRMVHKRRG